MCVCVLGGGGGGHIVPPPFLLYLLSNCRGIERSLESARPNNFAATKANRSEKYNSKLKICLLLLTVSQLRKSHNTTTVSIL